MQAITPQSRQAFKKPLKYALQARMNATCIQASMQQASMQASKQIIKHVSMQANKQVSRKTDMQASKQTLTFFKSCNLLVSFKRKKESLSERCYLQWWSIKLGKQF